MLDESPGKRGGKRQGSGRKKGTPNKLTADLKAAILGALEASGGQDYLEKVALSDPRTFCALLGKVLPMQVAGNLDVTLRHEQALEALWSATVNGANGHAQRA